MHSIPHFLCPVFAKKMLSMNEIKITDNLYLLVIPFANF